MMGEGDDETSHRAVSEWVDSGSDRGRDGIETGGVAALRREFQYRENAGVGQKMPILKGHYLMQTFLTSSKSQCP